MGQGFARERSFMAETLDTKLATVESRLAHDIKEASMKRRELADSVELQMNNIMDRVKKVEMQDRIASQATQGNEWQPNHVIFSGWDDSVSNGERNADVDKLLAFLPVGMQGQHLRPWTPRRNGPSIVKLRWTNTVAAAAAQLTLTQRLQYSVELQGRMKKVVVVVERHPSNTKRRNALRDAAEVITVRTSNDSVRHHVADGRVTPEGKTVFQVQNGRLAATSDYWQFDDLKQKAWTPVAVPLSR